jgi:hypothetical protein
MPEDSLLSALRQLIAFGPGGSRVADEPQSTKPPVEGLPVGGVKQAVDWFVGGLSDPGYLRVLFLVGAPGNGKSYWSRVTATQSGLQPLISSSSGIQHRLHSFADSAGRTALEIVNDASAPGHRDDPTPTISDLARAFEMNVPMLVNINRGVFYREVNAFVEDDASPMMILAERVLRLVRGDQKLPQLRADIGRIDHDNGTSTRHESLRSFIVEREPARSICVLAVRMDLHSIFVRPPSYNEDPARAMMPRTDQGTSRQQYRLKSPLAPESQSGDYWRSTPAGDLVEKFADLIRRNDLMTLHELNPVRANLLQLHNEQFRSGFLASLRSAELVSSRHFAFRHLWSLMYFLLLGDLRSRITVGGLDALETLNQLAATLPTGSPARLWGLVDLARHRSHQAIYGAAWARTDLGGVSAIHPSALGVANSVLDVMVGCDPVIDCRKAIGFGDGSVSEWGRSIRDAFLGALTDSAQTESEPLSIVERVIKTVIAGPAADELVTDFDRELDRSVLSVLRADQGRSPVLRPAERDALIAWYGDYLTRLVGLLLGATAWSEHVHRFVQIWLYADERNGELPDDDHRRVLRYVLPELSSQSQGATRRVVSLLRSRTEPIDRATDEPRVGYSLPSNINLNAETQGDRIKIRLSAQLSTASPAPQPLFSFDLDVQLVRELAMRDVANDSMSETSPVLVPRIERYRALATTRVRDWVVLDGGKVVKV